MKRRVFSTVVLALIVLLGLAGSVAVAASAAQIAEYFDGVGQEVFNAAVLGIAVVMLGWHNIWMSAHSKQLAASARLIGSGIRDGHQQLSAILIAVAVAVLREGSETVLFLYGLVSGGEHTVSAIWSGGALGVLAGASIGRLLYSGMVRIPLRWFFSATSALILLLAAGMASQMARFLIQGDVLSSLNAPVWNAAAVLPLDSPIGAALHALVGYETTPSGMQVVFYVTTIVVILIGMRFAKVASLSPSLKPR
jgi:high-affinity iron transporter